MKPVQWLLPLTVLRGIAAAQDWAYDNSVEEQAALDAVVEDQAGGVLKALKKDESPEYPLIYGKALPVPPVKEPLRYDALTSKFLLLMAERDI